MHNVGMRFEVMFEVGAVVAVATFVRSFIRVGFHVSFHLPATTESLSAQHTRNAVHIRGGALVQQWASLRH